MEKEVAVRELIRDNLQNLSEKDFIFLIKSYATKRNDYEKIADLIRGDEDVLWKMIDSEIVFDKVMNDTGAPLEVSPFFLFTLLLRKAFKEKSEDPVFIENTIEDINDNNPLFLWNNARVVGLLKDMNILNYIANTLAKFSENPAFIEKRLGGKGPYRHIVDMITDSLFSNDVKKFYVYSQIGNYMLFLSGMIPEYVEDRYGYTQKPVDRKYYTDFGKIYYAFASEHKNAKELGLADTLAQLSEGFEIVTSVMRFMNKKYLYPNKANFAKKSVNEFVLGKNQN